MKTYVLPADRFGCGFYRLIWPAMALMNQGLDITIVDPASRDSAIQGVMEEDTMVDVKIPEDADLMVFQRISHRQVARAVELIRAKGVAVVVDMDDDLASIHPSNPAFDFMRPGGSQPDHSWHNAQQACDSATLVTVTTEPLRRRYGRTGNGRIYDNYVPAYMLDVPHEDSDTIGWPGSVHSHPNDLHVMGTAPSRLHQDGRKLAVIGDGIGVGEIWGVPVHASGVIDFHSWPHSVTKLGIGVAPLADTVFNAAKSWLKVAEMSAVGVPWVASPRAEYARLHRMGAGLLAKDQKDWYRKLTQLASSQSMREELSAQGRDVMQGMTIEANAWRLAEIWQEAVKIERQRYDPLGLRTP